MAASNSPASKARASARAAIECKNKKVDPSCTECTDIPPVRAVILFPNLGTPLIVPPGEKKLNFFIAAEAKSKALFGVTRPLFNEFPAPAVLGYMYVDKHLRLYNISDKKAKEDIKKGRLWNDGKVCSKAFDHVKVWCLGRFHSGTITDVDGNIVANIRPKTIEQYAAIQPAHEDKSSQDWMNESMAWIYQIQIDIESLPNKPSPGEFSSLAWMVPVPECYKKQKALATLQDWEYQDKLIYDFLESQKKNPEKSHFPDLYEFILKKDEIPISLPEQDKVIKHRLKAWHPLTIGRKEKLSIGHLSDVHINSRHYALAKSPVQVIDGVSPVLGSKVDISFASLKNLFDQMKHEGADALFVTGDLLDFNRNIDSTKVGNDVKDQWIKFDIASNIGGGKLYRRGIDDMLMYSLLRYSYEKLKMPVFLTTGNHEAYDVPYGISPRRNAKVVFTGGLEMLNGLEGPAGNRQVKLPGATKVYKNVDDNAYSHIKANEGVPADHNLTVYEACLMYGPTYGQAITSENFTPENYDWFFTLFTPLADYAIGYKSQCFIALDWGAAENYINLLGHENPLNNDYQGLGILPRSVESVSDRQKELMENVFYFRKPKATSTYLFSHFTIANFSMGTPFAKDGRDNRVTHKVGDLNSYNVGTCEKNQQWLYEECVNKHINFHFSGHSHRAGVYRVESNGSQNNERIISAFDPDITPNHPNNSVHGGTKLIVSSCGGPIGVQNYDNELFGFNMRVPSGTLLNEDANPPIKAVKTDTKKVPFAKPRLCVAIDYLWVIWEMTGQNDGEEPIQFHNPRQVAMQGITNLMPDYFAVRLGKKLNALQCIDEIAFWLYLDTNKSSGWKKIEFRLENAIPSELRGKNYQHALYFADDTQKDMVNAELKSISGSENPPMFCEVTLKKPLGIAAQDYNYEDKWYFPVQLAKTAAAHWYVIRPRASDGEIPNWKWLQRKFFSQSGTSKRTLS